MNPLKYLELAAKVSRLKDDSRTYFHGAVGLRRDGVLVAASNGNPHSPEPKHHCEYRLLRKLGKGGTVFLTRTYADGTWAYSAPCIHCQKALLAREVRRCYYTTGPGMYMVWMPNGSAHVAPTELGPSVSPVPRGPLHKQNGYWYNEAGEAV